MSEFLEQSFSHAPLAQHLEYERMRRELRSMSAQRSLEFLRAPQGVVARIVRFPRFEIPNVQRALAAVYRGWQMVEELADDTGWMRLPLYERFELRPGRAKSFLTNGCRLLRARDDRRRAFFIEPDYSRDGWMATWYAPRAERHALEAEIRAVQRGMRRRHYLRGQVIRGDGTLLRRARVAWSDVALDGQARDLLWANSIDLLERRGEYAKNGVPLQRGILLYGPPGTGKTMIGRALAAEARATFVWVTAGDFNDREISVRSVFRLARKLRPSIVLFEDMDLYASHRGGTVDRGALGELLTQLDGFERNDGLIVIGTTNDLDAIEPALKDRPCRFDVTLEIGLPKVAARRHVLARRLGRLPIAEELLDAAAEATHGLSGAQVQEIAVRMVQAALLRGAVDATGRAQPTPDDLAAALAALSGRAPRKIGFGSGLEAARS